MNSYLMVSFGSFFFLIKMGWSSEDHLVPYQICKLETVACFLISLYSSFSRREFAQKCKTAVSPSLNAQKSIARPYIRTDCNDLVVIGYYLFLRGSDILKKRFLIKQCFYCIPNLCIINNFCSSWASKM